MIRNVGGVAPMLSLFIIEKRGNGAKLMSDHSQATVSLFDRRILRTRGKIACYVSAPFSRTAAGILDNDISPGENGDSNVDMQHYFMSPGFQAACPMAINIISESIILTGRCATRRTPSLDPNSRSEEAISGWSNYAALQSPEGWSRRSKELAPGHEGLGFIRIWMPTTRISFRQDSGLAPSSMARPTSMNSFEREG